MNRSVIIFLLSFWTIGSFAQRQDYLLNTDWKFRYVYQVNNTERRVDIPHTWNAGDALSGKIDYYRGTGNYRKVVFIEPTWEGKRLFLRFEGVNTVADVFVNQKFVGEHRGGYGAFVFDITDFVEYGKNNQLLVKVNNALQQDVMPLVGDFNFYGGIYRDVHLVVTDVCCISLTDYASPGVYLIQDQVNKEDAFIRAKVMLSNYSDTVCPVDVHVEIYEGQSLKTKATQGYDLKKGENQACILDLSIPEPRLWDGINDPFMYRVEVILEKNGKEIDRMVQPLGLRYFHTDPHQGFVLNGKPVKLHGVCRHQDRAELGNALRKVNMDEDAALIREIGANAVRLAHYPQHTYFYHLMDQYGIVVWAEIPFVGPGGYQDRGFTNSPAFRENGKQQLRELIRQHYNHPSICFWGLFNELKTTGDNPAGYVKELNNIAHEEDPTRCTTAASFLGDSDGLNFITDHIAWNKYYGWYGGSANDLGRWADQLHKKYPEIKVAISEYGAGASIYHQQDTLLQSNPSGWWHPENWQTYYHMSNWKAIAERPFIWGSFVWAMFDFGAAHRTEGDRPGINDKGLVTFDRKVKKDAFYFYKANWNKKDKFIYIAGRRNQKRNGSGTNIMVFTNLPEAELWIDGKYIGKKASDKYATIEWKGLVLSEGNHSVRVRAVWKKNKFEDTLPLYIEK